MKKPLLFIGILGFSLISAQRKVGINEPNPQETLDVKGTVRVKDVPLLKRSDFPNGITETNRPKALGITNTGKLVVKDVENLSGTIRTRRLKPTRRGTQTGKNGSTKITAGLGANNGNVAWISYARVKRYRSQNTPVMDFLMVGDGLLDGTGTQNYWSNRLTGAAIYNGENSGIIPGRLGRKGKIFLEIFRGYVQGTIQSGTVRQNNNKISSRNPLLFPVPYAYTEIQPASRIQPEQWVVKVGFEWGKDIYQRDVENPRRGLEWEVQVIQFPSNLIEEVSEIYNVGTDNKTLTRFR